MSGPASPRTRLDPSTRRDLILAAAEQVLASADPATVSVDDVASAAGVSRSLVHNYFGDRAGLVAASIGRVGGRFDEVVRTAAGTAASVTSRLDAVVRAAVGFGATDPGATLLLLGAALRHDPDLLADHRRRAELLAGALGLGGPAPLMGDALLGLVLAVVGASIPDGRRSARPSAATADPSKGLVEALGVALSS